MRLKYALYTIAITLLLSGLPARAQSRVYPTDLTDIAAASNGGRIIAVSSTLDSDPKFKAENLIDGHVYDPKEPNSTAGWVSNKFDPINMEYVTIGFKDNVVKRIGKIAINPLAAVSPDRWAKDVEVQVSTESAEGPYNVISEITVRRSPQRQEFLLLPANARFVRLMFRSNWGSDRAVGLGEVEIFEAIDTSDPMGQVIAQLESAITDLKQFYKTQLGAGSGANLAEAPTEGRATLKPATLQLIQMTEPEALNPQPVSNTNIAAARNGGKIVGYSSVYVSDPKQGADPAFKPENLIDGEVFREADQKGSAGWASQGFRKGEEYVAIGFKDDRIKLVGKVTINPASDQSRLRWARRINIMVTTGTAKDGPYRSVHTITLRSDSANFATAQDFFLPRPVEAKYVKFVFTANGPEGNANILPGADPDVMSDRAVALGEIEIYEAATSGQELYVLINRFSQVLNQLKRLHGEKGGLTRGATVQPAHYVPARATAVTVTHTAEPKVLKPKPAKLKPRVKPRAGISSASTKKTQKKRLPQTAKTKPHQRRSSIIIAGESVVGPA